MVVAKRLKLAVGPAIQNPVPDTAVGGLGFVLGFVPRALDLRDQRVLALGGRILGLEALELEVGRELLCVPILVRGDDVVVPVLLDNLLQIAAVRGRRVRDIVIRQPSL